MLSIAIAINVVLELGVVVEGETFAIMIVVVERTDCRVAQRSEATATKGMYSGKERGTSYNEAGSSEVMIQKRVHGEHGKHESPSSAGK